MTDGQAHHAKAWGLIVSVCAWLALFATWPGMTVGVSSVLGVIAFAYAVTAP